MIWVLYTMGAPCLILIGYFTIKWYLGRAVQKFDQKISNGSDSESLSEELIRKTERAKQEAKLLKQGHRARLFSRDGRHGRDGR